MSDRRCGARREFEITARVSIAANCTKEPHTDGVHGMNTNQFGPGTIMVLVWGDEDAVRAEDERLSGKLPSPPTGRGIPPSA